MSTSATGQQAAYCRVTEWGYPGPATVGLMPIEWTYYDCVGHVVLVVRLYS
jgi:hypothetical protein